MSTPAQPDPAARASIRNQALSITMLARQGVQPDAYAAGTVRATMAWRTGVAGLVLPGLVIAGLAFLATRIMDSPVTCDGQRMGATDRCVNLETGGESTLSSMSNAPIQQAWFWALLIGIVLVIWIRLIYRRFRPSASQAEQVKAHYAITVLSIVGAIQDATDPELARSLAAYLTEYDQLARATATRFGIELPRADAPSDHEGQ